MNKTAIIIQARMNSKRLPGKALLYLGDLTIIEWIIKIAKTINNINNIFLATSTKEDCDSLCQIAKKYNINIIRGDEENVLSRFIKIIDHYPVENIIRITGDDPCHDTDLINKALEIFKLNKYDYMVSSTDDLALIDGLIFEIFTSKLLKKINKNFSHDKLTQEHITINLRNQKLKCNCGEIPREYINPIFISNGNFKICVDEIQDYQNLRKVWQVKKKQTLPDTVNIIKNLQTITN